MKAAVCYAYDRPLVIEDIDIEPPKTGEVKVRVAACAICHSDIHEIRGDWSAELPLVAGHEAAGVVEVVGPGVSNVKLGDHVVMSLLRSCGAFFVVKVIRICVKVSLRWRQKHAYTTRKANRLIRRLTQQLLPNML